ncbi:MAG: hypothetical protein OFPII_18430 [Osedax symbiont Rs1]|nr:MAG: hypothetical protein OFPII_18430 [Osedax symbiont Rs1]
MNQDINRKDELKAFLLITVVLAPVLAVVIVSGFGFSIWISQLLMGPPGS